MNFNLLMEDLWANLSKLSFPFLHRQSTKAEAPKETEAKPAAATRRSLILAAMDLQPLLRSLPTYAGWQRPAARPKLLPPPRSEPGYHVPRFRPYVAKVPWHGGVRAFLSQLFPRYGHYCGPNWSSGKDGGSMLWDRRPIDWLDLCCYCHDIGYDTHDQAKLLKADLAFLQCLERPRMPTKGDALAAELYKSMCIAGLRNVLIPYRMQLVRLQTRQPVLETTASSGRRRGTT